MRSVKMENDVEMYKRSLSTKVENYKILQIPIRKIGNPDGTKEYCKIFPIFANLEGKCPIR